MNRNIKYDPVDDNQFEDSNSILRKSCLAMAVQLRDYKPM